jgi:hypothetical protein
MNDRRRSAPQEWRMVPTDRSTTLLPARLLGIVEGYAVCRRRGAHPFVIHEHQWAAADICSTGQSDG